MAETNHSPASDQPPQPDIEMSPFQVATTAANAIGANQALLEKEFGYDLVLQTYLDMHTNAAAGLERFGHERLGTMDSDHEPVTLSDDQNRLAARALQEEAQHGTAKGLRQSEEAQGLINRDITPDVYLSRITDLAQERRADMHLASIALRHFIHGESDVSVRAEEYRRSSPHPVQYAGYARLPGGGFGRTSQQPAATSGEAGKQRPVVNGKAPDPSAYLTVRRGGQHRRAGRHAGPGR